MSIESMELEFNRAGNYLITGFNEKGGDSNGSGKSTILNAIIWGLFGRTAKGLRGSSVTRWNSESDARVKLCLNDAKGHTYEIDRSANSIDFKIDGSSTKGHKADINQSIEDTFHTNYDLVLSSIMFTKGQADFLTDSGDASKKRLFKSMLRLEKIDKMYDKAKSIQDGLKTHAQSIENQIGLIESRLSLVGDEIEEYTDKITLWEDKHNKEILRLKEEMNKPGPTIDPGLENRTNEYSILIKNIESKIKDIEDRSPSILSDLRDFYKNVSYYKTLRNTLSEEINESKTMEDSICRYCGSKITKRDLSLHLSEKEQRIQELDSDIQALEYTIHSLETSMANKESLSKEHIKAAKEYQNLSSLLSFQQNKVSMYEATKKAEQQALEDTERQENPYTGMLIAKKKEFSISKESLVQAKQSFEETLKAIDIYGYLKWVLSREGVVGVIIEKTFQRLEVLINHYLSSICTEGFNISINPQRELKSGTLKDEIEVVITQEGRKIPYSALSGGQEQRVTIAALLALYKLSKELGMNRFNFLLLDEVIDLSLAEKGVQDIITLLERMEGEIRNIFVISHKDNLSSEFQFQIDVRRGLDGITHLEGVYQ
jgi:DNA repair exonuclease SbcCD ATPase subunit